jgi:hypothetical protein
MASTASLEGTKKAVFFVYSGKGWGTKWLIGSALYLGNFIIPFVTLIPLYGYAGQIARRVIQADEDPELPEWTDWNLLFSDGIKLFGASFLYSLPGILALLTGYVLMFALNFAFMFDPSFYSNPEAVMPGFMAGSLLGTFGGMLLILVGILLLAAAGLFLPPALGHLVAKGEFAAAFRVREWWPIFKANFSGFVLALVLLYAVSMLLAWLAYLPYFTLVLCFVVPLTMCVAGFLTICIHLSLIAVTYRDALRKLA